MHGAAKIHLKAVFSMRRIAYLTFLIFAATAAQAQSHGSKRPPELEKWNVWAGDWSLSGKAKDSPTGPEYKVDWHLHEHWILNGFFMQVDQTWKGSGPELRALEILSFDPVRKVHTVSGFSSDGSTWALTASFKGTGLVERGESRGPGGELIRCQTTWTFSEDRMALSGMQECERNGVRWTAIDVRGRKSRVTKSGCCPPPSPSICRPCTGPDSSCRGAKGGKSSTARISRP